MKKLLLMMLILFLSCDKNPASELVPQNENDINFEILSEYLDLSESQINEFAISLKQSREKSAEKEGRRHRSKRNAFQKEMFESLSTTQQEKMKALIEAKRNGNIPEEYTKIRNEKISKRLDLDDEQAEKFASIQAKIDQKHNELKQSNADKGEKYEAIKALKEESRSELKSFLTDEQFSKLEELNRPKKMRSKKARHNKDHGLKMMAEKLELTDDQKNQIKSIFDEMKKSAKSIKESESTKEDKKAAMDKLRKEEMAKIKSLLNESQAERFEQMKSKRKHKR